MVAETDAPWAALGTRLSAELYGCEVLLEGVEDHPENETRFVWLERKDARRTMRLSDLEPMYFKTSVVFWGLPDKPGALVEILQEFAARNVNLSKIESRPLKQGLGRYIFFADLEGSATDKPVEDAMAAVASRVDTLRILGSYPKAGPSTAKPTGATG
jgi:prephenate dehydratase